MKLIRTTNNTQSGDSDTVENKTIQTESDVKLDEFNEIKNNLLENPQLVALSEAKMWEMFKIILDKSMIHDEYTRETQIDFTILDPPLKTIAKHPLMLIASSGQENLLQHEVTRALLHLKWRFVPRSVFYFNIFFYMIFLSLFSTYTLELGEIANHNSRLGAELSSFNRTVAVNRFINKKVNLNLNVIKPDREDTTLVGEGLKRNSFISAYFAIEFYSSLHVKFQKLE